MLTVAAHVAVVRHPRLALRLPLDGGDRRADRDRVRGDLPGQGRSVDQERGGFGCGFGLGDLVLERGLDSGVLRVALLAVDVHVVGDDLQPELVHEPHDQDDGCGVADAGHELFHGNSGTRRGERVVGNDGGETCPHNSRSY